MSSNKPVTLEQALHAQLGASNCERWWNCPGSPALIASRLAPKEVFNEYAAEGTVAHSVAADLIKKNLGLEKYALNCVKGISKRSADGFEFIVTEEMLDAVNIYVDYISDLIFAYGLDPEHVSVETKVRIPHTDSDLFGTSDSIVRVPFTRLIVIDYKHGAGTPVVAQDNKQLLYYALGALLSLPEDDRENYPIIEAVIVQPRTPGDAIDSWEFPVDDLWVFHAELLAAADRTLLADAPLAAGPWCKYCSAKSICPALRAHVQETAGLDFANLPSTLSPYDLPIVEQYTNDDLANVLDHTSMIKEFLEALHHEAFTRAQNGQKIPRYKLVDKLGNSEWLDPVKAGMIFGEYLCDDAFTKPKVLSPTQMKVALKAVNMQESMVDDYITRKEKGQALAPINDKRKPVPPKAVNDFKDIIVTDYTIT